MSHLFLSISALLLTLSACHEPDKAEQRGSFFPGTPRDETAGESKRPEKGQDEHIDSGEVIVKQRIRPPKAFRREKKDSGSFAYFLRHLPLKPHGTPVKLHNGEPKGNQAGHVAVLDLPIGERDLHQCADAVMRLRAEHLYQEQEYDRIAFSFNNGFKASYSQWRSGKRIVVEGNEAYWTENAEASKGREDLEEYLRTVYMYAGSLSLSRDLRSIPFESMKIGDVLIEGGTPGHAVIVIDMVKEQGTDEELFLLAQSYMPAQEIHILKNPQDPELSPWYRVGEEGPIKTPSWTFQKQDLKRFPDR